MVGKCSAGKLVLRMFPLFNGGAAVRYWFYLEGFFVLHIMVVGYGNLTTYCQIISILHGMRQEDTQPFGVHKL